MINKLLISLGLIICLISNANARPHQIHHPSHHIFRPIVRHHHYHSGWNTFGEIVAGMAIGSFLVKDTYVTYNQRVNVPQHCVTLINQNTGMITTQCAQDFNQVIYITE